MANEEHVRMLLADSRKWHEWRRSYPFISPDLSGADLSGFECVDCLLGGVDFSDSKLLGGELSHASLNGAIFARADLTMARLHSVLAEETDFTSARLHLTDLSSAHLVGARFRKAELREVNFAGAELFEADFSNAIISHVSFGDVDLSTVHGLDTVEHGGPSTIGLDTLYRSKGHISEAFLRGCGVPDNFVTYMRSLSDKPIDFYSCFISYSNKDEAFAKHLYADLQNTGVRCWFDQEHMKIGDRIRPRIDESIRLHDKLLVVLSEHSVASAWVEQEVEMALERERRHSKTVLFPIRLDAAVMEIETGWPALIRNTRYIGDFTQWKDQDAYQVEFERLLRDLKAEGG